MNVTGRTKIYRRDFNGRPAYSRSLASQEFKDGKKGDWIREYESVQMPKGADVADGSIIEVRKGFEAVYKSKDQIKKKLVVQEFAVLDAPTTSYDRKAEQELDDYVPF